MRKIVLKTDVLSTNSYSPLLRKTFSESLESPYLTEFQRFPSFDSQEKKKKKVKQ